MDNNKTLIIVFYKYSDKYKIYLMLFEPVTILDQSYLELFEGEYRVCCQVSSNWFIRHKNYVLLENKYEPKLDRKYSYKSINNGISERTVKRIIEECSIASGVLNKIIKRHFYIFNIVDNKIISKEG